MIVKMHRVFVVARGADREALLERLGELGLVHLAPVDAAAARPDEKTEAAIGHLQAAIQVLGGIEASGDTSSRAGEQESGRCATAGAEEVLAIQRESAELQARLAGLAQRIGQLSMWGDVKVADIEALRERGVNVRFYAMQSELVGQVEADCVERLGDLPGKEVLVGAVSSGSEVVAPEEAREVELPAKDRPALRAEAAQVDAKLRAGRERLAALASLRGEMEQELAVRQKTAQFMIAQRGGMSSERLFALQGWCPAAKSEKLTELLREGGIEAGVERLEPDEDEQPPTLIRYPKWAVPMKGLFDILATFPGYREFDLSAFFMIALPVFAAMLIGDAGYGLVFLLPGVIWYKKMAAKAGPEKVQLLMVIGGVTLLWGVLTANYFGLGPAEMAAAGGYVTGEALPDYEAMAAGTDAWATAGKAMMAIAPLWRADGEAARMLLIQISFLLGCLHLVLAHVRQAIRYWPNQQMLAEVGWCVVLVSMLGVIWMLFFGAEQMPVSSQVIVGGLFGGLALVILFGVPRRNPLARVGLGLASSLLPAIGTFSDTMSYIRLMAVGMASFYIAMAFNSLGASVADAATWFAGAPIAVFGHLLNIALGVIAIFAHGVRLNMLEFSNNAGVQWAGYPYAPFSRVSSKER